MAAKCRLCFIHFIHLVVFGLLAWRMYEESKGIATLVGCIITGIAGIILLVFSCGIVGSDDDDVISKEINLSNLIFILASLTPFGIGIHYSHLNAADLSRNEISGGRTECVTLADSKDYGTFIIYLLSIASLIITSALYPRSEEEDFYNDAGTKNSSVMSAFALLDIIDMAELLFSDIGCYQTFGPGALAFFYIVLAVAMVLTTVYAGLEQPKDEKHNDRDLAATICNLIFNDVLFLVLRIVSMAKTGHVYFGLIFVTKEAISSIFRLIMICSFCSSH